jgi:acyl-CoA thioester hydrolase
MGVAHHAAYIPWLEAGRTEILRDAGISYAQLEAAGIFLVVTRLEVRYRRAGRYDDLLDIRSRVVGGGRVKIEHEYEVRVAERIGVPVESLRASGDDLLATAASTLACVDRQGRVRALPDWLAGG